MKKRVCVFVDGENLRHSICDLFAQFDKTEYLPKGADWELFFDWIVEQVGGDERVRTYWYAVGDIDFFPYAFPDLTRERDKLRMVLEKSRLIREELVDIEGERLNERLKTIREQLLDDQDRMRRRFLGWKRVQEGIAAKHKAIEFRLAGSIRYDLFTRRMGKEKAVDVKLAIDVITLREIYDIAVIVSGDQDYVPAVQVAKDQGRTVVNVCFERRDGRLLPGGARRLNQVTDWSLVVPYEAAFRYLFPDESGPVRAEQG